MLMEPQKDHMTSPIPEKPKENQHEIQKCERCGSTEEVEDTLEVPWWDWLCKKCRNPDKS